jgi:hypothetical protein
MTGAEIAGHGDSRLVMFALLLVELRKSCRELRSKKHEKHRHEQRHGPTRQSLSWTRLAVPDLGLRTSTDSRSAG